MKLATVFALAAAVTVAASPAAFAKDCGAHPAKPTVPDGKTATDEAMKSAQGKVAAYIKGMNTYLTCLGDEIKDATAEAKDVSAAWTTQTEIFKKTPAPQ